jgi:hypothetical protein
MRENPFDSDPPPNEGWWERELHRNEKLMDKYLAVMDENPDWVNWKHPEDLYNKVHFGIDPLPFDDKEEDESLNEEQEHGTKEGEEAEPTEATAPESPLAASLNKDDETDLSPEDAAMIQAMNAACKLPPDLEPLLSESGDHDDYPGIAKQAREFSLRVMQLGDVPGELNVLLVSAGKVGANLAGGHGLGYANRSICGNIVKCRWALADCEFCREMLEHHSKRTANPDWADLCREAAELARAIKERIARLRARVWWQ